MQTLFDEMFSEAATKAFGTSVLIKTTRMKTTKNGFFCFGVHKIANEYNISLTDTAAKICMNIKDEDHNFLKSVEIVKNGYVNIVPSDEFLQYALDLLMTPNMGFGAIRGTGTEMHPNFWY